MNKEKRTKLPFFGIPALWPTIKKYKAMLIRMFILGSVISLIDAIYPMLNRYVINNFIMPGTINKLPFMVAGYLTLVISQAVISFFNVSDCSRMELYTNRDLRNNAFRHMQEVSLSCYNTNNVGYIHARVMSDSGKIGEMMSWRIMDIIWFGGYIIFAVIAMLFTDLRLALYLVILIPVAIIIIGLFEKKLLIQNHKVREINSEITADINEGITGVRSIKTLVAEDRFDKEFNRITYRMYRESMKTGHFSALFSSIVTLLSAIALSLVLWKGGELSAQGIMKIGTLSVFMSYAMGVLEPISIMVNSFSAIIAVQVNIERYMKLMNTEGEVFDSPEVIEKYGDSFNPKTENWEKLIGDVEFKDVTFKYPDGDELVLEDFNLHVKAGTNVAIVGETGAGKSTLVNLVCRFFEPTKGQVLIDGRDAKDRSLKWLHSNIGYVLQTPHLFSGTLRENLTYGRQEATDEEIWDALKMISADTVVKRLKNGLDSLIGEGGESLSTGEKQLMSIARAILADPAILILDEATASIDTVTERTIQNAISTLIKGRTSFVIAHRLSTIASADTILVVADGKIIERGDHRLLMKQRGVYYQLYTRQYEEMLVDDEGIK